MLTSASFSALCPLPPLTTGARRWWWQAVSAQCAWEDRLASAADAADRAASAASAEAAAREAAARGAHEAEMELLEAEVGLLRGTLLRSSPFLRAVTERERGGVL